MAASAANVGACILAGTFAALGSVFGKLGSADETVVSGLYLGYMLEEAAVLWAFRAACYSLLVVCNVVMWSAYVRSLQSLSSVQATVLNTSANFFLSGILGCLVFKEPLSVQWFAGSVLVLAGLLLLTKAAKEDVMVTDASKED